MVLRYSKRLDTWSTGTANVVEQTTSLFLIRNEEFLTWKVNELQSPFPTMNKRFRRIYISIIYIILFIPPIVGHKLGNSEVIIEKFNIAGMNGLSFSLIMLIIVVVCNPNFSKF